MPSCSRSSLDFLQSHYTVLLPSFLLPFSCPSWWCCSLISISRTLQVRFFLLLSSLLSSHRWIISAMTQLFFFSDSVCQASYWLFQSLLCWRWWSLTPYLHLIVHDAERCKLPACHTLEGFQYIGIFQLFEVKLESCVFWLFFSDKGWMSSSASGGHVQCLSWKTSCSCNVPPDRKRFLTRI